MAGSAVTDNPAADDDYLDDDGLDEDGNFLFECARYWDGTGWHCPLAGTEDCDWECPER